MSVPRTIVRYGARWRLISALLFLCLATSYILYVRSEPFPHGGTRTGVIYGIAATLLMIVLILFGVRKRSYKSRMGKVEEWLQAHIYLGLLTFLVVLAHTGFRFRDHMAITLFVVVSLVTASGIFGAILYKTVPRLLTDVEGNVTPDELAQQINQIGKSMARVASSKSKVFQDIYASLIRDVAPERFAAWRVMFRNVRAAHRRVGDWAALLGEVPKEEREELRHLLVLSRQQKDLRMALLSQQRYRNLLSFWLWLHLPLSVAMIVLLGAHIFFAFYYARIPFFQ